MKVQRSRISPVILPLLLLPLSSILMVGCGGKTPSPAAQTVSGGPERGSEVPKVSDLDQPVEQLMTAVCEHRIPQHTCDECRYQVGVVKVPDALFDPAKGGTLRTLSLGTRPVTSGKDSNGEVRLNEEKAVYVSPRASGVVRFIRVDLGSRVVQGQVLFEVDSPEFRQANADYVRASAGLDLARATERRESDLYSRKISAQKDLLEAQSSLKAAEAEQRAAAGNLMSLGLSVDETAKLTSSPVNGQAGAMPVRAPFAGIVLERSLGLGALVQPGDKVLLMADTSKVWVLTTLYEGEVAALLEAQGRHPVEAEVTVAAYPGKAFKGTVERIGGTLDEATRTTQARVVVDNPDNLLRSGMFAKVRLLQTAGDDSLAVPDEAILQDEGRSFVFVHASGPYFIRRPVTVGRASGGWSSVSGGVKERDLIITTGAFLLKSDVLRSKMGAGCAD